MLKNMKLGTKILVSVLSISILSISVLTAVLYFKAANMQKDSAYEIAEEMAAKYAKEIDADLDSKMIVVRTIAGIFERAEMFRPETRRDRLQAILKKTLEDNPGVLGVWTVWEPNELDGNDAAFKNAPNHDGSGRFVPYFNRAKGAITSEPCLGYETPGRGDWYWTCKKNQKETVMDPYIDSAGGQAIMMTSLVAPIMKDGRFVGEVGMDLDLSSLQNTYGKVKILKTGYGIVVGNNAARVVHPKKELLGKPVGDDTPDRKADLLKSIKEGKVYKFEKKSLATGDMSYLVYEPFFIGNTNSPWSYSIVLPLDEMLEDVYDMRNFAIILGAISLIILALVLFFISRNIGNIIEKLKSSLANAINSIVKGDLSFRANPKVVSLEFQPLLEGTNNLIEAFIKPINLTAEYIDRISKGDLPPRITEEYHGDFNEIKVNLNTCIDAVSALVDDAKTLSNAAIAGKLDARARADRHQGEFRNIINGVNGTLDAVIGPLNVAAEYMDRISKGDIPPKITDNYHGDFNEIKNNLNTCIDAIKALVDDANMLANESVKGNFNTRADLAKHSGDFSKVIFGVNQTLDTVVDRMVWYESIIDATPFPIHVIDMDMNWTFLNKAFEKLMVDAGYVVDRKDAVGKPCCTANANICNTESCGIKQLHKGIGVSYFDWAGMRCKQDTSYMINAKGEKIGYVEVVTDLTNILSLGDYNKVEIERLAKNLESLSRGVLDFDLNISKPNEYTQEAFNNFEIIKNNLLKARQAVGSMITDAEMLADSAVKGQLSARANASKHQGDFGKIIKGINNTLDAVTVPLNMAADYVEKISKGDIPAQITDNYNGDFNSIKNNLNVLIKATNDVTNAALNIAQGKLDISIAPRSDSDSMMIALQDCLHSISELVTDANSLAGSAVKGELSARADAGKHKGDYRKIIEGMNNTLEAIVGPINEVKFVLNRFAVNDTSQLLTKQYSGEWIEVAKNTNAVGQAINHVVSILENISVGNLNDLSDLQKIGKRSENDKLVPSAIKIEESIGNVLSGVQDYIKFIQNGELAKIHFDANKFDGVYKEIFIGLNAAAKANLEPIAEILEVMKRMSNSDFTSNISGVYHGDFKDLKDSLNLSLEEINEAFANVLKTARSVESGSHQVADSSTSLSQGATEQAASLEEMTSSMSEVASQTKRNAENANIAKSLATEARNSSDRGEQEMSQLMKAMDEINESSKNIAKIIKVIDEIAFQTNLLALNAAVEAARAGVHGQGFAVVAEEVRNLAARSAQAAKETAEMIEGSIKTVGRGSTLSQKTQEALNEIRTNASKVNDIITEIAVSSNEQAQGIAQINLGLNQIDKVTQQNTATAEESATSADELSSQSKKLMALISRFKINASDSQEHNYSSQARLRGGSNSRRALSAGGGDDFDDLSIDL